MSAASHQCLKGDRPVVGDCAIRFKLIAENVTDESAEALAPVSQASPYQSIPELPQGTTFLGASHRACHETRKDTKEVLESFDALSAQGQMNVISANAEAVHAHVPTCGVNPEELFNRRP
jgi:hypothetical protein